MLACSPLAVPMRSSGLISSVNKSPKASDFSQYLLRENCVSPRPLCWQTTPLAEVELDAFPVGLFWERPSSISAWGISAGSLVEIELGPAGMHLPGRSSSISTSAATCSAAALFLTLIRLELRG